MTFSIICISLYCVGWMALAIWATIEHRKENKTRDVWHENYKKELKQIAEKFKN